MAKTSPTQKALAAWRAEGYEAAVVERRLPIPGKYITQDLFGCIDIVAMKAGQPLIGIQATTRDHISHRMVKSFEKARTWATTGARFVIVGFGGKTKKRVIEMNAVGQWIEQDGAGGPRL